jgi:hypothetical protein
MEEAFIMPIPKIDKGIPGENRGRKANGSNVTTVTMIARPPKK